MGLVAKFVQWNESAIFFDGSSLGKAWPRSRVVRADCPQVAYIFAMSVYAAVTIPNLRTMVTPAEVDTMDDRIEAMRILSAGNTIMMLVLGAILGLQVSLACQ